MEKRETVAPRGKQNLVDGDDIIFTEAIPETNFVHCLKMSTLIEKIKDTACAYDFAQPFKKECSWLWI